MKLIILSDSHRNRDNVNKVLAMHKDADAVFFLGDGLTDVLDLSEKAPPVWFTVKGNCDGYLPIGSSPVKSVDTVTLCGKKILFTHGHLYGVKHGKEDLIAEAKSLEADIVLFGHTHTPYEKYLPNDDLYLFNPGSIGEGYPGTPTFGIITLTDSSVLFSHGKL